MESTSSSSSPEQEPANRALKIFLWILIFAAGIEFVLRGPVRFLQPIDWNDLAQNYAASRLWLRGQNPSNPENFVALWQQEVHSTIAVTVRTRLAPPLGTMLLLSPIAALPWHAAKIAWTIVLLAAFAFSVLALARVGSLRLAEPRTLAFIAGALALAPFHTGIATGNVSIVVVGACATAIWAAHCELDVVAGALFAIACTFKPHVGAFLVLYYLVQRRWRLFGSALAFTAGFAIIAALWMQLRGVVWFHDYLHNAGGFVTANRIDAFSADNPIRFMLINLQVPFYSFTGNTSSANLLALSTGAVLVCVWIYLTIRNHTQQSELLALATIAVLCLLPLYHRLYDAALLIAPLCWCMKSVYGEHRNIAHGAMVLMVPFLIPSAAVLQQLVSRGAVPAAWTHSWLWDRAVMPHQTWLILLLGLVLLYAMVKNASTAVSQSGAR